MIVFAGVYVNWAGWRGDLQRAERAPVREQQRLAPCSFDFAPSISLRTGQDKFRRNDNISDYCV